MAIEIVSFRLKQNVIVHSYASLPEGKYQAVQAKTCTPRKSAMEGFLRQRTTFHGSQEVAIPTIIRTLCIVKSIRTVFYCFYKID